MHIMKTLFINLVFILHQNRHFKMCLRGSKPNNSPIWSTSQMSIMSGARLGLEPGTRMKSNSFTSDRNPIPWAITTAIPGLHHITFQNFLWLQKNRRDESSPNPLKLVLFKASLFYDLFIYLKGCWWGDGKVEGARMPIHEEPLCKPKE